MLILFSILFRINPPKKLTTSILPKASPPPLWYCSNPTTGETYTQTRTGMFSFCDKGYSIEMKSVTFKNCKSDQNWFMQFDYANLDVNNCNFMSCTYTDRFISTGYHNSNTKLNFVSNTISNCYDYNHYSSRVVYSFYEINFISGNSISFANSVDTARAFYFEYHYGLTFTGNSVKNAKSILDTNRNNDGAGGLHAEGKNDVPSSNRNPMVFSNSVFTSIDGDPYKEHFGTTVFIYYIDYDLTITNVTFENCRKEYSPGGYGKGYMFQIEPKENYYTRPRITFKKCKFSNLQFNGQNGGGIGMFIRKPPTDTDVIQYVFTITYEDTTFEHLYFMLDSWGGGAISYSHDVEETRYTNVNVNNCTFNDVSSKSGGGGAIYFNSPTCALDVRNSKFINTYTRDTSRVGGAIYVKYQAGDMPVSIVNCEFENTKAGQGGAICIEWGTSTSSLISITGCTFKNTNAYTNYHSIYIMNCDSNYVYVNNNNFLDCGSRDGTYAIYIDAARLNFNYNQVIFSQKTSSCGCVQLNNIFDHTFKGNIFQNARNSNSLYAGAAINYANTYSSSTLVVQNNTFKQIQGNNQGRCIYINYINTLTFKNNTFEDCPEGGILVKFIFVSQQAQFTVDSCRFIKNIIKNNGDTQVWVEKIDSIIFQECYYESNEHSSGNGGAIFYGRSSSLLNTKVIVKKCEFYENSANTNGSAISIETNRACEIIECTFVRNTCQFGGGVIYGKIDSQDQVIKIEKCDFNESTTSTNGGAIFIDANSACEINTCTFTKNTCKTENGAVYCKCKTIKISLCEFNSNTAGKNGAALFIHSTSFVEISECNFLQNTCGGGDGTIYCNIESTNQNTKISKCNFIENTVNGNGAAISLTSFPGFEIDECTFIKNTCKAGDGTIYSDIINSNQNIEVTKCQFSDSKSQNVHCFDIFNSIDANINVNECIFNDCGSDGIIINVQYVMIRSMLLQNCIFNSSKEQTAIGIYLNTNKISLINNTFHHFRNHIVHISGSSSDEVFEVIDNLFSDFGGSPVFDIENYFLKSIPTIKGNTFDNIKSDKPLLRLKFIDSIDYIALENNTFSNFEMSNNYGGLGLEIDHENNEVLFNISFNNCYFIKNTNNNNELGGGALSFSSMQNNGNLCLSLFDCFFENNHKDGEGSSIYLNIKHQINIESCYFFENYESKGTIYIDSDDERIVSESSSITITNCNFKQNRGGELSSIYIAPSSSKTVTINSCTFDGDEGAIFLDKIYKDIEVNGNTMTGIIKTPALTINQYSEVAFSINENIFDSCTYQNNQCFNINMIDSSDFSYIYEFTSNVVQNNIAYGHESYFGSIDCNRKVFSLQIKNISFINNTCDCLYGGGTGIQLKGVKSDVIFEDCLFINNTAKQNQQISRPTEDSDVKYYNGDGGAIQLGYICTMSSIDIFFLECSFKNNHAERHGGAIAIQTNRYVELIKCKFENNEANCNFDKSSPELLIENHFNKKNEGRGGAIYINPSYAYEHESCTNDHYMQSIEIESCVFIKNKAYDGYGIYIEGDDVGTTFKLTQNTFTDNYNESNYNEDANNIYGAVITAEMNSLNRKKIIDNNTFNYSSSDLKVKEVSYVDHFGKTPTQKFSNSDAFTKSDYLPSNFFSKTKFFTNSEFFSKSEIFSESRDFSETDYFSQSYLFSKSRDFMDSSFFSKSNVFSGSEEFSKTDRFSNSAFFSKSLYFSQSETIAYQPELTSSLNEDESSSLENSQDLSSPNSEYESETSPKDDIETSSLVDNTESSDVNFESLSSDNDEESTYSDNTELSSTNDNSELESFSSEIYESSSSKDVNFDSFSSDSDEESTYSDNSELSSTNDNSELESFSSDSDEESTYSDNSELSSTNDNSEHESFSSEIYESSSSKDEIDASTTNNLDSSSGNEYGEPPSADSEHDQSSSGNEYDESSSPTDNENESESSPSFDSQVESSPLKEISDISLSRDESIPTNNEKLSSDDGSFSDAAAVSASKDIGPLTGNTGSSIDGNFNTHSLSMSETIFDRDISIHHPIDDSTNKNGNKSKKWPLILGLVIGFLALIIIALIIIIVIITKKKKRDDNVTEQSTDQNEMSARYTGMSTEEKSGEYENPLFNFENSSLKDPFSIDFTEVEE